MKQLYNHIIENFNSKVLMFEGEDKPYELSVKTEFVGNRLHLKYALESGYDRVARVSLYYVFNDEKESKKWHSFGYTEVPESMFEIDHFYVEPKFRNAGIGTAFFNQIMQSITDFDKSQNLHSKMVFVRLNTPEATAFFNKWNARENDRFLNEEIRTTRVIIDTPCTVSAKNFVQAPTPREFQ